MKKRILNIALAAAMVSSSSWAVEGGDKLNWNDHQYLVESNCTGTIIGGRFVLFAGHCGAWESNPFPRAIKLSNGKSIMPSKRHAELYYEGTDDVALWELNDIIPTNKVIYLNASDAPVIGDSVYLMGFGRDNGIADLHGGFNTVSNVVETNVMYVDSIVHSVEGDSGAPVLNANSEIIAVNAGSNTVEGSGEYAQSGSMISAPVVKNWILNTVNGWHSETNFELVGQRTVELQSLHSQPTDLNELINAGTFTSGDVQVLGGSCITDGMVDAFQRCTLDVSSNGREGFVDLGNYKITVNPHVELEPEPDGGHNNNGGESGGGSIGFIGMIVLGLLASWRKTI